MTQGEGNSVSLQQGDFVGIGRVHVEARRAGQGPASLVVIGQRLRGKRRGSVSRPIGRLT